MDVPAKGCPLPAALRMEPASCLLGEHGDPKLQGPCPARPTFPTLLSTEPPLPSAGHTVHRAPDSSGTAEGTEGKRIGCQLLSASRSQLLWQREGGGGGATRAFWKAGNVPSQLEPNSTLCLPSAAHVATQAGHPGQGGPHPRNRTQVPPALPCLGHGHHQAPSSSLGG